MSPGISNQARSHVFCVSWRVMIRGATDSDWGDRVELQKWSLQ